MPDPQTRKKVYKDGKVVNGTQLDSRGKILGVKGKMSDDTALPEWATSREKTEQYQKWVNAEAVKRGEKPPINNWGKTQYGKGRFGPQTAQALKKYGDAAFKTGDTPKPAPKADPIPQAKPTPTPDPIPQPQAKAKPAPQKEPSIMEGSSSVEVRNKPFKFEKGEIVRTELNVKQNGPVDRNLTAEVSRVGKDPIPTTKKSVFDKAGNIVPYLSNVTAMFTNADRPDAPGFVNPVGARRVNYDDQRVEADRQVRGANANASNTLDENTAAGVRATNFAGGLRAKNSINAAESNMNAQIGMNTDATNAGIEAGNVAMGNRWNEQLTEANNADKMNRQDAIANASDKFIEQQNQKNKMTLDGQRLSVFKHMFKESGVMDRTINSYNSNNAAMGLPEDQIVNGNRTQNSAIGSNRPLSIIPSKLKSVFTSTSTASADAPTTRPIGKYHQTVPIGGGFADYEEGIGNFKNKPVDRQLTGRVSGYKVRNAFGGYIRYAAGGSMR